jgi:hypothetical protein
MKKIEFVGSVSVEKLVKFYGINDSFFNGNGVYRVKLGSRGLVDGVEKVSESNSVMVREVEDFVREIESGELEVSMMEYGMEKVKEFVFSEFVDWYEDELGIMYVEGWDEEDCFEYYYVEMI